MKTETENIEKSPNLGGARAGAGRKKGGKNKSTLVREEAERIFKDKVLDSMEALLRSQMALAKGVSFLYKVKIEMGSKGAKHRSAPQRITDPTVIDEFLAGKYDESEDEYYFITTEKPDNKALDSLIDRVFGKSVSKLELSGNEDKPLSVQIINYGTTPQLPSTSVSDTTAESN